MSEVIGRFHCERTVRGLPVGLSEWRVTTSGRGHAEAVVRLLGGSLQDRAADDGTWEVLTASGTVGIVVEGTEDRGMTFRLVGLSGLGVFEYRSGVWTLAEVLGSVVGRLSGIGGPVRCELGIGPVMLTTLTGVHVRYLLPSLSVVGPSTAVA